MIETPPQEQMTDWAVELTLALMGSVDLERKIRPIDLYPRLKSALQNAASSALSLPEFVSLAGDSLQIEALASRSSSSLYSVERSVGPWFEEFRAFCEKNALYIVAIAQATKDERRRKTEAENIARGAQEGAETLADDVLDAVRENLGEDGELI